MVFTLQYIQLTPFEEDVKFRSVRLKRNVREKYMFHRLFLRYRYGQTSIKSIGETCITILFFKISLSLICVVFLQIFAVCRSGSDINIVKIWLI
jgi:hypothetical protein